MKVNELIDKTARAVVSELKKADLIKENKLGTFKKTEKVLYQYPEWKTSESKDTQKFVQLIDMALKKIESDDYYELIDLKYFQGWTHERIAEYFGVDEKSIRYHRKRLIECLRPIIFSDEFIKELFSL